MHLLAAKPGGFSDEEGIIDLQQTPADIVILCAQDSTLGLLARYAEQLPDDYPSIRLANFVHLTKPAAFDLYAHKVLEHAKLIIISLLGGKAYLPYGVEQLEEICARTGATLAIVPGDDEVDTELQSASNLPNAELHRIWRYLREGGVRNTENFYRYIQHSFFNCDPEDKNTQIAFEEPRPLPKTLIYCPDRHEIGYQEWFSTQNPEHPVAVLLFYRSHFQSGNTQAFSEFIKVLQAQCLSVLPIAVTSLKDESCKAIVNELATKSDCNVFLNTTAFSIRSASSQTQAKESNGQLGNQHLSSQPADLDPDSLFDVNAPVLQVILAANSEEDWLEHPQGLRARDIAMNIALPEMDGRVITRAISFKEALEKSDKTQYDPIYYQLNTERAQFVAELALHWATLAQKPNSQKRVALILANYPTREGRIGNGVGLDTPASTLNILKALQDAGYPVDDIPDSGTELVNELLNYVTNDLNTLDFRACQQSISLESYQHLFEQLPQDSKDAVLERWGHPENDPKVRSGRIMIPGIRLNQTFVGIQPARGFNIDLAANYHDPDLVPPHSYLAFYFWLRHEYQIDAIMHIGKHGNLEWLPGKSVALSDTCWPDIALGPLPHLYPFIVNDPGEGAQAKRRSQAVVLDHLMPPMTRAETYGELFELEQLVDELYQAMGLDIRREEFLRKKIIKLVQDSNILNELNLRDEESDNPDSILNELDAYLCELKEAQIRGGLHIFGQQPDKEQRLDTLVALARLPRGQQRPEDASIIVALSQDLQLAQPHQDFEFNPLDISPAEPWEGNRPALLSDINEQVWRTEADTLERLEHLAKHILAGLNQSDQEQCAEGLLNNHDLPKTKTLISHLTQSVFPAYDGSPEQEIKQVINGLAGGYVPPGASGAPTRGRLDVLPTGRNFYSVDSRSIPTPAAWELGKASAQQIIMRHLQDHGDYPKSVGISVWGTSTMRTGGDDIAQAFALMGIQPIWAPGSNRVVDFEIMPNMMMNHPRVDVTLRVSGFFRDAFPNVMHIFDAAVQALADHEEPGQTNTIKNNIESAVASLTAQGIPLKEATTQARYRVFGSKPGAYGAGLQGLIDEGCWDNANDLAEAYVNWGGFAYGQDNTGTQAFEAFEQRLGSLEAVIQNQDNREHDLLDSDDYYQFQGGMTNAVRVIKGETPEVYHGDHSNPSQPKIKTLQEELNRVIRSRVTNPKWIKGMQQHGYKGAFEMAATVDYLFAYDATTDMISDYQYANVAECYLFEPENAEFLKNNNPTAMKEMTEKMIEAIQRNLWQEPGEYTEKLEDLLLDLEGEMERSM